MLPTLKPVVVRVGPTDRRWVASNLYTESVYTEPVALSSAAKRHWIRDLGSYLLSFCLVCSIIFRQGGAALGYFALFVGPLGYGVFLAQVERLTYSRAFQILSVLWPSVLLLLGIVCQIIAALNVELRTSTFQTLGILGVVPIGNGEDFALTMLPDLLMLAGASIALYFRTIHLPSKKFPMAWAKFLHTHHGFHYVYFATLLGCSSPFPSLLGFGHLLTWALLLFRWSRSGLRGRMHWGWRVLLLYSVLHVLIAIVTFSVFPLDSVPANLFLGPLASREQMWVLLTCGTVQIILLCSQHIGTSEFLSDPTTQSPPWWQSWWFVGGCRVLGPAAVLVWALSFPSIVGVVCLCLLTLDLFQLSKRICLFRYILLVLLLSALEHYVEGFLFPFLPEDSPEVSLLLGQPSTHAALWVQLLIAFVTTVHIKVFTVRESVDDSMEGFNDEVTLRRYRSIVTVGAFVAVCQWLLIAAAVQLLPHEYLHGLVVLGLLGVMLRPPSSRMAWVGLVFAVSVEFVGGYGLEAVNGAFPGALDPGFVRTTSLEHYAMFIWGFFVLHLLYSPAYERYRKLTLQPFPLPPACHVHIGATFFVPFAQLVQLNGESVSDSFLRSSAVVIPTSVGRYQPPVPLNSGDSINSGAPTPESSAASEPQDVNGSSSLAMEIFTAIFTRITLMVCHVVVVVDAVVRASWHSGVVYVFVGCVSAITIERQPSAIGVGWLGVLVMLGLQVNTGYSQSQDKCLWALILLYGVISFVAQYLCLFPVILAVLEPLDPVALGLHPGTEDGWAHHSAVNGLLVLLAWAQFHSIDATDRFCIAILPEHASLESRGTPWWYQAVISAKNFWFVHASNITIVVLLFISVAYTSVINAIYLVFALSSLLLFPQGRYERCMLMFTMLDALAQYTYQLLNVADPSQLGPWIGLQKPFSFWQHFAVVTVLNMQMLSKQQPQTTTSWFDKAMKLVYDGNTLEVTYLVIVFVAFDKRNVFSCIDVLIVGCCLLSGLPRIKKAWAALTTYWLVVFVLKWVCWLLNKRFLNDMPWAAFDQDKDWLGLQTTGGWTTEFVVVCAVVFQLRAFRADAQSEAEIPMIPVQGQEPKKTEELEGIQAAVKAYLFVLLSATFLVGVLAIDREMSLFSCLYICVALYLASCFHRSIAEQERWSVLGLCNFVVLLCKLVYWAPFFTRTESWGRQIGLRDSLPDLVLFALVLVERRLTRLSLFRKIREYEDLAEKRRVTVYAAMVQKTNRKRQVALLEVMIQYLKRQVRYLRRWGKREDDALQNLRDFGFSIPTEAAFNNLEDVIKDMERECAAIEQEGLSTVSEPGEPSAPAAIPAASLSLSPKGGISFVVSRPMPVLDLAGPEFDSSLASPNLSSSSLASPEPTLTTFSFGMGDSPVLQSSTPPRSPSLQPISPHFKPSSRSGSPLRRSPSYLSPQIGAYASTRSRRKQGVESALERRSSNKTVEIREEKKKVVEPLREAKVLTEPLLIRVCDRLIAFLQRHSYLGTFGCYPGQSRPAQLVASFGSWVFAHATLWCYCAFLLAHMLSQNVASCVYPLSMFTFALMSEPSKRYWATLLRYTQIMLVLKTAFRFTFLSQLPLTSTLCAILYYPNAPAFIQDISFSGDVMGDFLVMLALVGQRHLLILRSLWYKKEVTTPVATQRVAFLDRLNKAEEDKSDSDEASAEGDDASPDPKVETEWYWGLKEHFARIVVQRPERSKDYYARILGLELLFFVGILSLYQTSNIERQSLTRTFARNEVPLQYFLMLLGQFCLIIADRVIYLRRNITAKFWFQVMYVFAVHIFSIMNYADLPPYNKGLLYAAYVLKCIYFYYSGKQIFRGYPPFAFKQFLTNDPSFLAWLRYIAYRAVPFLFELKTLLDWTCATSTLMMYDWLKLEDIHASIYFTECDLHYRRVWGRARGDKYPLSWKIPLGVLCIVGIALIVWGPFLVFLTGVPIGSQNLVTKADVKLSIEVEYGTYALFEVSDADAFVNYDRENVEMLDQYGVRPQADENVQEIVLNQDSSAVWPVTPPSLARLEKAVREGAPALKYIVTFDRPSGVAQSEKIYPLDEIARADLALVLEANCSYVRLKGFYPLVYQLNPTSYVQPYPPLIDARLWFRSQGPTQWWALEPVNVNTTATSHQCPEQVDFSKGSCTVTPDCTENHGLVLLVLSSKNFLGDLSSAFYTSSIVTLYITFVFSMGRFLRIYVLGMSQRIIYEDIPDVSFIKELCEDIYSARSDHEFELEETMYGELVQLYRSPETMIAKTLPVQPLMGHTNWPQNGQLREKQE